METSPLYAIDWVWLARQLPWLIGGALLLATLSWGDWRARVQGMRRRVLFSRADYAAIISFSLGLIAVGLALNALYGWDVYVSGVVALYFFWSAAYYAYRWRRHKDKESTHA